MSAMKDTEPVGAKLETQLEVMEDPSVIDYARQMQKQSVTVDGQ